MYVGGVGPSGIEHLLWEVVGNAIDEHLAGRATWLRVRITGDEISVEDDGDGIPLGPWRDTNTPAVEVYLTHVSRWPKHPHVHVGRMMFGVGLAVTNALSSQLIVEVRRDGRCYRQRYEAGRPLAPLADVGPASRSGTHIRFTPDFTIFERCSLDRARIATRLRELAGLNPALTVMFEHEAYRSPDGTVDLVEWLAGKRPRLHARPLACRGVLEDVEVDVALLWTEAKTARVHGLVSCFATLNGTHIDGYRAGLAAALRDGDDDEQDSPPARAWFKAIERGLVAVVHVRLEAPCFGTPTRDWLRSPEAESAARVIVGEQLRAALTAEPALRERLLARVS